MDMHITLQVDGVERRLAIDTRTTLLDALRDRLGIMSPKKGCDHGQCGACTVLLDGRRVTTCLAFAVAHEGATIVTAEGLARDRRRWNHRGRESLAQTSPEPGVGLHSQPDTRLARDALHPLQQAFIELDGFQCGYCTPGQICSAVGMIEEARQGHPSHVTRDLTGPVHLTDDEIRERMSGNLCRCGAYVNIVAAIRKVAAQVAAQAAT